MDHAEQGTVLGRGQEMIWPIPTPEEQVKFLRNIQRLLSEGQFTASYKFALVQAIADLSVLNGEDTGATLELSTKEIAAKFIDLYWQQARPFQLERDASHLILKQNTGQQAAIINKIVIAQQEFSGSLFRLKQKGADKWVTLVAEVEQVVRDYPLKRLQTICEEKFNFLYEYPEDDDYITLKSGVAFCFRAFYKIIRDFIEAEWVRFVQKVNSKKLGNVVDLSTFLFGQERNSLEAYQPILFEIQRGVCLYCQGTLTEKKHVDHFVPWSRYPIDIGQNFVLVHETCNKSKSDFLAAENHLATWFERNKYHQVEFQDRLTEASLPCDSSAALQIARWVYEQTEKSNGQVWVKEKVWKHLDPGWVKCFEN